MVSAGAGGLVQQVNLFISGRKLKDLDTFSKSDPQCRLYESVNNQWREVGKTEVVMNNLNPDFQTCFTVAYHFEKVQKFKFTIVDVDDNAGQGDMIGEAEVMMGSLMGAARQTWTSDLEHAGKKNRGQIIVRTQTIQHSNFEAKWALRWQSVRNQVGGCMGMCPESAFYHVEIMKEVPGQDRFVQFKRMTDQYNTADVRMRQQSFTLAELCNNERQARLKFCLVARSGQTLHTGICSIADLESGKTTLEVGNGATLVFENFEVREKPTFMDYLRAGWQVSMTVAIDYTASNGNPSSPSSLHFLGPNNPYQNALFQVGKVVEPYDHDKLFPVFGFGGVPKHMGMGSVSHCFPLNGVLANPEIPYVEGIVSTYQQTLPQIELYGPTLFAPLLQEFLNLVRSQEGQQSYQILLLLTDGIISDMSATKDLIYQLAEMPVSIIIVGVGNADFTQMEELDGDDGVLTNSRGQAVARDIVQFCSFNECIAKGNLNEEVLKEVPGQLCSYMERSGFVPVALEQVLPVAVAPAGIPVNMTETQ